MYPIIRLGKTIFDAVKDTKGGTSLSITDTGRIEFTSSPTDMDNFFEMNNGRIITLFDLGRTDFAIRTGLGKRLLTKRWGLVVAGSNVQYRKRVFVFEPVTITTKVSAFDDKWIYIEQTMWVKDTPTSSALLRTGVTKKGRVIPTKTVFDAMGLGDIDMPPTGYVKTWIEAEAKRPWPPKE